SNADVTAYRAKRAGRARVEVFDDELRRQLSHSRRIARSVGRLLDLQHVPVLLTPIAELNTNQVVGFDCRVDWSEAGLEHDVELIERVVDETGMSRALDLSLLRTAMTHLAAWQRQPPGPIVPGLSVALTRAGAVSPVLPELVRECLGRSGVLPALCWIGIPESAVAEDLGAASRVVDALHELGVGVALRDFGSGVSSLEHLRRLPTPTMTIAGPLVEAAREGGDCADSALLAAIVQYARAIGRIVVVLGVTDLAHAAHLRDLGCSFGSGPAFGPEVRPDGVADSFPA
ncbi:MAG TPA: EAL domain-containing protein, partial [Acidimicrobiia bacterium]|nr:EAL domain-containing protein [Acidimicrobiia bacterium]